MELAKETLLNLIEKIAEEQKYVDHKAIIKEVNSGGANVTSALFLVTLSGKEKEDLNLFAKVAVISENTRESSPIGCPFTTELFFYCNVLKEFERLQEKHNVDTEHRLIFPKFYGSHDKYLYETIVLENLIAQGFKTHDRLKPIDLEYASTAIELMAKFHALSIAYNREDPIGFKEDLEKLTYDTSKMKVILEMMKPKMLATVYKVATDENREILEKFLGAEDGRDKFMEFLNIFYDGAKPQLLVHGDFKASNLMHRRQNDKLEMTPVDFQLVHNASPVTDLMYFLFTATDEEFRRQHYHLLLGQYYEQLKLALERMHVDPEETYSEETYRKELQEMETLGILIGVILLPMIVVAEENLPSFDEESDISDFLVAPSDLFKDRFNGIINNYKEWGLL